MLKHAWGVSCTRHVKTHPVPHQAGQHFVAWFLQCFFTATLDDQPSKQVKPVNLSLPAYGMCWATTVIVTHDGLGADLAGRWKSWTIAMVI
jgi:hypothetical protein